MFYHVCGDYVHREENFVVIDCGGVGYRLTVSANTADALGMPGEKPGKSRLLTYFQVREDGVELFGFYTDEELSVFKMLISVSGVGPKAAMAILSLFTPARLASAVCNEDTKAISRANGVGAKTAARIVLELKDRMRAMAAPGGGQAGIPAAELSGAPLTGAAEGLVSEVADALSALGYSRAEVTEAVRHIDTRNKSVEQVIMDALKYFSK